MIMFLSDLCYVESGRIVSTESDLSYPTSPIVCCVSCYMLVYCFPFGTVCVHCLVEMIACFFNREKEGKGKDGFPHWISWQWKHSQICQIDLELGWWNGRRRRRYILSMLYSKDLWEFLNRLQDYYCKKFQLVNWLVRLLYLWLRPVTLLIKP